MNDSHGPAQRVIENHQQFLSAAGGQAEEGPGRGWTLAGPRLNCQIGDGKRNLCCSE